MLKPIDTFPDNFEVDIDQFGNRHTSVIPRYVREFGGYSEIRNSCPEELKLSKDGRDCQYIRIKDSPQTDAQKRPIRCVKYQKKN